MVGRKSLERLMSVDYKRLNDLQPITLVIGVNRPLGCAEWAYTCAPFEGRIVRGCIGSSRAIVRDFSVRGLECIGAMAENDGWEGHWCTAQAPFR